MNTEKLIKTLKDDILYYHGLEETSHTYEELLELNFIYDDSRSAAIEHLTSQAKEIQELKLENKNLALQVYHLQAICDSFIVEDFVEFVEDLDLK